MKRAKVVSFAFLIVLGGCSSLDWRSQMTDYESSRKKDNEDRADVVGKAASAVLTGKTLWLKPPKLNECEYDLSLFPVFSQIEILSVTAFVAQPSIPTFRIAAHIKWKEADGQLTFMGSEHSTEFEIPLEEKCFYDFDPRKKYKMSPSDWALIAKNSFRVGFSPTQLQLSIGKPDDINRTVVQGLVHEQWVYENGVFRGYIYFDNGKLKSWQD